MRSLSKFIFSFLFGILDASVDVERAFSDGWPWPLQVNHLLHAMGSQTFEARVSPALWVNTLFLPSWTPASIIAEASRKAREVTIIEKNDNSSSKND